MNRKLYEILIRWLEITNHLVDKERLETYLLSHPEYGSLISITDTLTEFGIENTAAEIPKEHIGHLSGPFLGLMGNGEFVLARLLSDDKIEIRTEGGTSLQVGVRDFLNRWTGMVIVIDAKPKSFSFTFRNFYSSILLAAILLLLLSMFYMTRPTVLASFHFAFSLTGLLISTSLLRESWGVRSSFINKVCNIYQSTSCTTVLNSRYAKVYKDLTLSDLCLIYFTTLVIAGICFGGGTIIYYLSVLNILTAVYSLFLQKVVIKKWCPLCLGIVSVLLIQAVLAVSFISQRGFQLEIPAQTSVYFLVCLLFSFLIWVLLRPLFINAFKFKYVNINALGFRRNSHLFIPFYTNQALINTSIPGVREFSVGSDSAAIQIMALLSPFCPICAHTNAALAKAMERYPEDIKITIRLLANYRQPGEMKTKGALYLLNMFERAGNPVQVLAEWYSHEDATTLVDGFYNKKQFDNEILMLKSFESWATANGFTYSPVLLINDRLFPGFYDKGDVLNFLEPLIVYEKSISRNPDPFLSTAVFVDNT